MRSWLIVFLILSLILTACNSGDSGATPTAGGASPTTVSATDTSTRSAQISEIKSDVTKRETESIEWQEAAEGDAVGAGGGVRTGDESRVRIDISDGTIVRIAPNTEFTLLELSPAEIDPVTKLQLDAGKVFVWVTKALGLGTFEVETPSGVATVRGSLMSAEYDTAVGRFLITCLEGICQLAVGNVFTTLTEGQQTEIPSAGETPLAARLMDEAQLDDWAENFPGLERIIERIRNKIRDEATPTPPGGGGAGTLFKGLYVDVSGSVAETTIYTLHFVDAALEAEREQYRYQWDLILPAGDQCTAATFLQDESQPWQASWTHNCIHSPGEMISATVSRDNQSVTVSGSALGPGRLAPSTPGGVGQTACDHPYLPLRAGASWSYSSNFFGFTWSVNSVTGDTASATAEMAYTVGDISGVYNWLCDSSGLVSYQFGGGGVSLAGQGQIATFEVTEHSGVFLPPADLLVPGYSWQNSYTLQYQMTIDGQSFPSTHSVDETYSVVGTEPVTFNGQTYDGVQIEGASTSTMMISIAVPGGGGSQPITTQSTTRFVYARGIGIVSSTNSGGGSTSQSDLVSYSVP